MFKKFKPFFKITDRSDNISEGSVFFAFKGKNHSELDFLKEAYLKKSKFIIFQDDKNLSTEHYEKIFNNLGIDNEFFHKNVVFISNIVEDLNEKYDVNLDDDLIYKYNFIYEKYCKNIYDDRDEKLKIYGITGTKGKTTTAILTFEMFKALGYKVALLSGAYNQILDEKYLSEFTTEKPDYIYAFLNEAYEKGVTHVVIEVSAQALTLERISSLTFESFIFTNFSDDHGEFYRSKEEYFKNKIKFLNQLKKNGTLNLNINEYYLANFFKKILAKHHKNLNLECFGMNENYSGVYSILKNESFEKTEFDLIDKNRSKKFLIKTSLSGSYNIDNILAAYLLVDRTTFELEKKNLKNWDEVFKKIENITIPGRANKYKTKDNILIYIDMAHSSEAFNLTLLNLKKQTDNLIVVFGCGGDRDIERRIEFAEISEEFCDKIYITEDNPRNEDLDKINNDIMAGFKNLTKVKVIKNREEAIKEAIKEAKESSIVAILGKGIQQYQIRKNEKIEYSDLSSIQSNFDIFAI